ncbi:MAG TPA: Z1 domain-containing protein [Polyangiaceae bacterium]|nr:Z1 domain-containing protein [Polyangiaceae bacterium]
MQSGKTISMTSVASLGRDNGFGLVIVLAGTTENLLEQSWKRFKRYLQLDSGPRRLWYMLTSADHELAKNTAGLRASLASWKSTRQQERRAAAFLVVMKNHAHLDQLATALQRADVRDVPTLIIDDEADQAGLNNNPGGVPSTTYTRIRAVRAALGPHTYLQYTATPQAPLLISLADQLSPDFSIVLDAGRGYTGGQLFFVERRNELVHAIPQGDITAAGNPPIEPPESLLAALRVFFLGVALAYGDLNSAGNNRSMLVHPSREQLDHDEYYKWVVSACARWKDTLELPADDPEVQDVAREFEPALSELRRSGAALPTFGELRENLAEALGATLIHKVNSETGTEVDWSNAYAHILVGGQKLNRGYTVEGLTVTYMPRSAGTWTADTIQQLGRFFGYKRAYLGLCRTYLNPDVLDVFEAYVDHEEDLRKQLRDHPGPLREWTRALYLNARMRPTRHQVLTDPYYRVDPTQWIIQVAPFDDAILDENRALVAGLYHRIASSFVAHPLAADRHSVAEVRLQDLMDLLLFRYRVVGDHDEAGFYAARHLLLRLLEVEPEARAAVVRMGNAVRLARGAEIVKLHQGYDRKTMGKTYPGAGKIHDPALVTVQIHELTVRFSGLPDIPNVPTLAVRLPSNALAKTMIVQPTPASHAPA